MSTSRRLLLALAAALALGGGWLAFRAAAPPRRPDIVLIVVDSLRADQVDAAAAATAPMPALSRLAAQGVYYERAYAPSSWTLPSVASIFTAHYASEHQARWWGHPIAETQSTLAGILRAHGYATAGFSAHAAIGPKHKLDQGFDTFAVVGDPKPFAKPDAGVVNAAALQWIDARRGAAAPYFLYLHYMDVHYPYRPHRGLTAPRQKDVGLGDLKLSANASQGSWEEDEKRDELWRFTAAERARLRELYDGEARYIDGRIAELLAALAEKTGREALVVVTADHGEEFGEHDVYGHATTLYEAVLRVPLVIALPDRGGAHRVAEPVSVGGLAPALLAALGIAAPPDLHIPGFRIDQAAVPAAPPYAYAELLDTRSLPLRLHARAVVGATAKLLETPAEEKLLFIDDPAERAPRRDAHWEGVLEAALRAAEGRVGAAQQAPQVELDAQTRERLRNLGYETGD